MRDIGSAPISHELDLELVGSIGNFWIAAQLLIVERVLNPILFSVRVSRLFGGGRGDMYTFSCKPSPVSILTTFGIQ